MIKYRRELYKLLPPGSTTVEVGCAEGLFSNDILSWKLGKHYLVDAWQSIPGGGDKSSPQQWHNSNYDNVLKLIDPYGDRAIVLRGLSVEMATKIPDDSLNLVYIDCGHQYSEVLADIKAYLPKLKSGGIMAFHDYETYSGVKQAVNESFDNIFLLQEDAVKDAGAYIYKP